MSEKDIDKIILGPWFGLILIFLPIVVAAVSFYFTSRVKSVSIRAISILLFSGSTFLFCGLLQFGWAFRNGMGPGNVDDMYGPPQTNSMQEFLEVATPLFLFCGLIFIVGLGLCWRSSRMQKDTANKFE
jgi:cytochrome bd-type quinol oxidase subunit 1